jgi:hypothetical protein
VAQLIWEGRNYEKSGAITFVSGAIILFKGSIKKTAAQLSLKYSLGWVGIIHK